MTQPFKCPSCGGPLEYDGGDITVRCHYCTNHVIVPEELRAAPVFNAASLPLPAQLMKLTEIGQLIRSGNKIAAIKLYRETFGAGLKDAKDAVENLAAGRAVSVPQAFGAGGNVMLNPQQIPAWPASQAASLARPRKGHTLFWVGFIVIAVTATVLYIVGNFISNSLNSTLKHSQPTGASKGKGNKATSSSGMADVSLEFGSEGLGAGQFKDARSLAVDGEGHIYVGEYTGGRVQVFDAEGKFLSQWMVDRKMPLLQLAAERNGTVYVVQGGDISRYEGATGKLLGKLPKLPGGGFANDVTLLLDGGLVAVAHGEDIVRLDRQGQVVRTIKAAISEQSGDSELSARVAADGPGNIYAAGRFNNAVFKFGPNGKYITRFGGKGNQPGQFSALFSIAVDGQGRVYVGDSSGIQVFDENGRYLDTIKLAQSVPFGLVFNDKNELFVAARTSVYKLSVNKN
jgi:DNA-directed RNA polymerase subunit RPC12/RpoP